MGAVSSSSKSLIHLRTMSLEEGGVPATVVVEGSTRRSVTNAAYVLVPLFLLGALLVVGHGDHNAAAPSFQMMAESGVQVEPQAEEQSLAGEEEGEEGGEEGAGAITPDAAPNLNVASDAVKDAIVKGHELITAAKHLASKQFSETKERVEFQMNEYLTQVYQNRLDIAKADALATMDHATQLALSYDKTASKGISGFNAKTMAEKDALTKSVQDARNSAGLIVQNGENAAADIIKKGEESATPQ